MGLINKIPKKSELTVIGGIFKAVLNDPAIGKYDFTNYAPGGTRYNVARDLGLKMQPRYLYYFHQMNFSLSIELGVFLRTIEPNTYPVFSVRDSSTAKSIFHLPFRMINYYENTAIDLYHINLNESASMNGDFQLVLYQSVPELVGISDIYAQVSLSVYEITDDDFILDVKKGKK